MDDEELMHEILATLLDDTSAHIHKLETAVSQSDSKVCMQLAHYCKGSCSNVGANAVAALFQDIERQAKDSEFQQCAASLVLLGVEMERLRAEITAFNGYALAADSNAFTASAHSAAACFDSAGSPPTASSTTAGVNAAIPARLLPESHSVSADPAAMDAVHPRTL